MDLLSQATTFVTQIYNELCKTTEEIEARIKEIELSINSSGTYNHTYEELLYGAKVAWRNNGQCIGKSQWKTLKVFDCRDDDTEEKIFLSCLNHMGAAANNGGHVAACVTFFRPQVIEQEGADQVTREIKIWNPQIIRYAGYVQDNGDILGDPDHVQLTKKIMELGWKKEPRTEFDVLPVVVQMDGQTPKYFDLPEEYVKEVHFEHPTLPGLENLQLKWHGIPCISNMKFELGGIIYSAAAFNGWYATFELIRNFTDAWRYNKLEPIAKALGLHETGLSVWKDRTLVEFQCAILHSFNKAKITIVDHHTISKQFHHFVKQEEKEDREVNAKWSWMISPISGNLSPLWNMQFRFFKTTPEIAYQTEAYDETKEIAMRGEYDVISQPGFVGLDAQTKDRQEPVRSDTKLLHISYALIIFLLSFILYLLRKAK